MNSNNNKHFDVIILGSGLGGSILATVLAKHNVRVLMIDKGVHPRFAIGEAMTPDTDLMASILSYKYSIPEIGYLSSFENICENISPSSCGLKRAFSFIYHREGEKQALKETNKMGLHPSSHLFRPDIDQYMAKVAVKYGAKLLENTNVIDVNINKKGVEVKIDDGQQFTANYMVDGSGYNSLLSRKFNLRDQPTRLKTHSRSIFTHMVDVSRYDDCIQSIGEVGNGKIHWYEGTLHHLFDGGWMWVIPFNNHDKSNNPYCSVGLNVDPRRFPKTDSSPEQEFKNFLARFPDIAIQFKNAKPVRNWVSTDRLQYSSHTAVGERFFLLPHAAGFIDPLFSNGLINTCTVIIPLASRIMKALSDNDYSTEYFVDIEQLQQRLLDFSDNLVNCSYISFADYNLWDAWRRFWLLGSFIRQSKAGLKKRLKIAAGKGEELAKPHDDDDDNLESLSPSYEGLGDKFFQDAIATVEQVEAGLLSPGEATQKLLSMLQSMDFMPENFAGMGDVSQKHLDAESDFMISERARFLFWIKSSDKPAVKKYFDYDTEDLEAALKLSSTLSGWS